MTESKLQQIKDQIAQAHEAVCEQDDYFSLYVHLMMLYGTIKYLMDEVSRTKDKDEKLV